MVALLLGTTVHVGATGRVVPMPDDPQAYARALYAELHAADARISHLPLDVPAPRPLPIAAVAPELSDQVEVTS